MNSRYKLLGTWVVETVTWKLSPDGRRLSEDRHAELNGATVDSHQEFVKQ